MKGATIALATLCAVAVLAPAVCVAQERVVTKTWDSAEDFRRCTWDVNIEVTAAGTVRLKKSVLLQDELGATHYANTEGLSDTVWAKKLFVIDDPRCDEARLFTYSGPARAACNGTDLRAGKTLPSTGWRVWSVPPEALRPGVNEFVFSGGGSLVIEHSLYPNRSARSLDGGKSWDSDRLGFGGVENGEYLVRLRLAQYPPRGVITSEVFDLTDTGGAIRPRARVTALRDEMAATIAPADGGPHASTTLQFRSGPTREPDASWPPWGDTLAGGDEGAMDNVRFAQWRATLESGGSGETPALDRAVIAATIETERPAGPEIEVLELTPPDRRRRSQPFAHQGPGLRLARLRDRHKLAEVVAKADTELEKFVALREWARFTAPKGWDMGSAHWIPPWDALILLETNKKPIAMCMCTHFSVIFTQCALALGYNAREVILDHHCVAEIWSNELGKWILMDTGNSTDPTLNCHFERDGVPLSALEIRRLWKAGKEAEIDVVYTTPRGRITGDKIGGKDQCNFTNFRRFCIPFRNNHLVSPFPGELEHGQAHYYADQYLWWEDEAVPVQSPEYGNTSARPEDFYWALNKTGIDLQQTDAPGTLQVTLDTETPNFETFMVSIDGGDWDASPAAFEWKLHAGENALRAKSVNKFGVAGGESVARLEVKE